MHRSAKDQILFAMYGSLVLIGGFITYLVLDALWGKHWINGWLSILVGLVPAKMLFDVLAWRKRRIEAREKATLSPPRITSEPWSPPKNETMEELARLDAEMEAERQSKK